MSGQHPEKVLTNGRTHDGVRFSGAASVLADLQALTVFDVNHSDDEGPQVYAGASR